MRALHVSQGVNFHPKLMTAQKNFVLKDVKKSIDYFMSLNSFLELLRNDCLPLGLHRVFWVNAMISILYFLSACTSLSKG